MPLHLASALLHINELFDLDDWRKSPDRSGIQMSTNKPSAAGRLVRKKNSCMMSGMYCRCRILMWVISTWLSLMLVLINHRQRVRTRDSSWPSYQRQDASLAGNSVNKKLPAMKEDRRAATLRANKSVICVFYISQIVILSSNDLSERF